MSESLRKFRKIIAITSEKKDQIEQTVQDKKWDIEVDDFKFLWENIDQNIKIV